VNKKEYLRKLKRLLPESERKDIIGDYEDHFATGLNEGKSEEMIADELGDPYEVVKAFGFERPKLSPKNIVFAAFGLIFFDLIIGIAIVSSIFAIWISLWSVVLGLLVSGVGLIVSMFFTFASVQIPWYLCLTGGISLLGLTGLFGIGMIYVTKYFFIAMKWFFQLHVRVFQSN
jgi:uncharacterized membrane protein